MTLSLCQDFLLLTIVKTIGVHLLVELLSLSNIMSNCSGVAVYKVGDTISMASTDSAQFYNKTNSDLTIGLFISGSSSVGDLNADQLIKCGMGTKITVAANSVDTGASISNISPSEDADCSSVVSEMVSKLSSCITQAQQCHLYLYVTNLINNKIDAYLLFKVDIPPTGMESEDNPLSNASLNLVASAKGKVDLSIDKKDNFYACGTKSSKSALLLGLGIGGILLLILVIVIIMMISKSGMKKSLV